MKEIEVVLTPIKDEVKVPNIPNVGDKCWFLPNPVGFGRGTVSGRWTDGEGVYVQVNEWNPKVRWSLDKITWEMPAVPTE